LIAIQGLRWIVPDLIGFGRSDKPKRQTAHTWEWHRDVLMEWLTTLDVAPVLLAYAEGAKPLVNLLCAASSARIVRQPVFAVPDALTNDVSEAWRAPFPDRGYEAALRALGCADSATSGPSPSQALQVANTIARCAADTMGYCRP
jgi:tRNA(adenine34) deaminase